MRKFARWELLVPAGTAAAVAALLIVGLAASHRRVESGTVRAFQKHQLAIARGLAASVEAVFTGLETNLRVLAGDPDIVERTDDLQPELDSFLEHGSGLLNNVAVVDPEGELIFQSPRTDGKRNIFRSVEFQAVRRTGEPCVSEPKSCYRHKQDRVVRILVPILRQGRVAGAAYGCVSLAKVWTRCIARPETGHESFCWVIEDDGELLYHANPEYIGRTWDEIEQEWHASQAGVNLELEERGREVRSRVQGGEEGTAEYVNQLEGVEELVAFAPIRLGNQQYGLAITTPMSAISGPIDGHAQVTRGLMAGVALFFCAAAYLGVRGMAARARWLAEQRHTAEHKQARDALCASDQRYRSLVENIDFGITLISRDYKILMANAAMENMFNKPACELIGKECFAEFEKRDAVCPHCPGTQAMATGRPATVETEGIRDDGSRFSVRIQASPVLDAEGTLTGFIEVVEDITEAKLAAEQARAAQEKTERMNAELARQAKELHAARRASLNLIEDLERARASAEAANRAKSEFLANMSHEIRTPMTAIVGFADVLLEHGDLDRAPPERIDAAKTIKRNSEYLLSIINDILDLSKIEAGRMTVERTAWSPCRIVAEVVSLARVRADAKGLSLNVEYIGPIPDTIQTDPVRLRQILINLIGNAIKFTEVGGVRLITRLVTDAGEPFVQFDVADTGPGISEDQVARLFQPFTQADTSTTRKFGGTGLGLTISKRFAELLGGDVTVVETQEGVGTRFRVTVATGPLDGVKMIEDPMSATTVGAGAREAKGSADEPHLGGCRILLAEDGPDNQRLISFVVQQAGAEVTVVEDGKLAAEAALAARDEGRPFDVILMDMQMPVMDGYEATGLLRRKGYTGPIIALTAHAMEGDREKCLQAGCDDYASKPVNRGELIETIHKHLEATAIC